MSSTPEGTRISPIASPLKYLDNFNVLADPLELINTSAMRWVGLCVVFVLAIGGSQAHAEKVKANQPAKLLAHPGERAKVLLKIKTGQSMTVLAKEGRWVKVRLQGRTGFVPRSKLEMADDGELARNTRRRPFVDGRGTQRGFDSQGGPEDRIGADATESESRADDDEDDRRGKASAKDDDEDDRRGKASAKDDDENDRRGKASRRDEEEDGGRSKKSSRRSGDDAEDGDTKRRAGHGDSEDDDAAVEEPQRATAHVRKKTKIFTERDKSSEVAFTVNPSEVIYPSETKGTWTLVESADGDVGWIPTASLDAAETGRRNGSHRRSIDVTAGLGVAFIQQSMNTVGTTLTGADQVPDVYDLGTAAATIDLGGRVLWPWGEKYLVGGELLLDVAKTLLGGVNYKATTTGLTVMDFHLRGALVYPTTYLNGMSLVARLGFRYRAYLVNDYGDAMKNAAKIPQETLIAPTIGGAVLFPNLTRAIGLEVGLDTILFGSSVTQTAGLEDGATPGMRSIRLSLDGVYHWRNNLDLRASYSLDYASYQFGAPHMGAAMQSIRGHTGTDVSRTDMIHLVSIGIAKGF